MHIVKRLALSIPALMVITTIAFLLSKAMPGSSGSFLLENDMPMSTYISHDDRAKMYRQHLQRTGQDKAVFYFSIGSQAEPDTLFKVFPEDHRSFLQQLCFTYGNWSFIAAYYQSILRLEKEVKENFLRKDYNVALSSHVEKLFVACSEGEIKKTLNEINLITSNSLYAPERKHTLNVQERFELLLRHQRKKQKFIPVIRWHGIDNQYHAWVSGLLKGDMGNSLRSNRPVSNIIGETLGITLTMTISAFALGWAIALILGTLMNMPQFSLGGKILMNCLYVLDTIPLFLLSFLLLLLLSLNNLQSVLPSFGLGDYQNIDNIFLQYFILFKHLLLPILCLTLAILPYFTGQVVSALKGELTKEYVKTARAKGLPEFSVLKNHVLKNALTPLVTIFTDYLPSLFSGALVVEVIFAIPGMGRLFVNSVNARDYPVILGIILIIAIVKIASNALGDLLYSIADPRIKLKA